MKKYAFLVPLALGVVLAGVVLTAGQSGDDDAVMAPMFEVDPLWPKNLPNHWLMGPTIGVDVDAQDNIWVLHRNTPNNFQGATEIGMVMDPPVSECCQPGPPVLVFDQQGNLVDSWGGPGTETGDYVWPESNHGIAVDHMDNVWIGGNGQGDAHVLKFTRSGEFLLQAGRHNARMVREEDGRRIFQRDSLSEDSYGRVAEIGIDPEANEAYFADGYYNKRVAVVDIETGAFKRGWGAYGNVPDDDYDFGGPYVPGERSGAAVPRAGALQRDRERRARLRLRPRRGPRAGLPEGRDVRRRAARRHPHPRAGLDLGPRLLARTRTRRTCTWPTART